MDLFSLRKIRRICPQGCGPGLPVLAHGSTDFIKHRSLASGSTTQIQPSEPVYRLLISTVHHRSDGRGGWLWSGAARYGRARRLAGVRVFSTYGGRFDMRFAPTGSQRWGERDYVNLNWRRVATGPGNGEAAWPVHGDGEGGLRWSFGSKDVRQGFHELPSSSSTDQLLRTAAENLNLVAI
jgi:hypothetical protein